MKPFKDGLEDTVMKEHDGTTHDIPELNKAGPSKAKIKVNGSVKTSTSGRKTRTSRGQ